MMRTALLALSVATSLSATTVAMAQSEPVTTKSVVAHYADLAHANYSDALQQAKLLDAAIKRFVENPTEENLNQAKNAWLTARVPYQQSEVFRFGNKVVDDWEGQLNAWPLDEGFIDYVDDKGYQHELGNEGARLNLIAARKTIKLGSKTIDTSKITPELLASLNELGGSEANVATGYHAIEFLLWGQDLNGTKPGAGKRPVTDYVQSEACTHGNCDRRAEYLVAVSELLLKDLEYMVSQWSSDETNNYRSELLGKSPKSGIRKMLYGMGSLALGELAGERIKVALEANSTEDEHDCFSDNTHNSHFYNAKGIQNIYLGEYRYVNGKTLSGPSLADLVINKDAKKAEMIAHNFDATSIAMTKMVELAETGMRFDQMIAPGNEKGYKVASAAIQSLVKETESIKDIAEILGVKQLNPDTADHTF